MLVNQRHSYANAMVTAALLLGVICFSTNLIATQPVRAETGPQKKEEQKEGKKDKSDKKDVDNARTGRPVLWEEPTDIESRDLFWGAGGKEGAPDPSGKFTFVRRSTSGTAEKIIVDDDKGRSWTVKFGPESKPETAATRIVWAMGYHVDQDYFVKRTHIEGRGGFDVWDVRFERRDDGHKEVGEWTWKANPFVGTRELDGLKTLMVLLNNWDLKDMNNKTVQPNKNSGDDSSKLIYYISDLGATLGKTGYFTNRFRVFGQASPGSMSERAAFVNHISTRNLVEPPDWGSKANPGDFAKQSFIDGVKNGEVVFHYEGRNPWVVKGVKVENARWIGSLLRRLSDKQLEDAFRSGGFADAEVATYVRATRDRINQLVKL